MTLIQTWAIVQPLWVKGEGRETISLAQWCLKEKSNHCTDCQAASGTRVCPWGPFNWAENPAQPQPQVQASRTSLILKWGDRVLAAEPKERLKITMVFESWFHRSRTEVSEDAEDRVRRGWGHNDQRIQSHSSEKWLLPSRVTTVL